MGMQSSVQKIGIISLACVMLGLTACASKEEKTQAIIDKNPSPIANNAPDWVNKGSGAFTDGGQKVFYGVGIVSGIKNKALAVSTSDDRGRAEIAKIMNSYVATLTKDYQSSATTGDMSQSDEEQFVSQTSKVFAEFTLHGAIPINHWVDPSDGTVYSLVKLDMASVQESLAQSKDLDGKVSAFVKGNADKAFDELSAEEAKH